MLNEAFRERKVRLGAVSKLKSGLTSVEGACHLGCPLLRTADEDVD
jgi:hypothetical protein